MPRLYPSLTWRLPLLVAGLMALAVAAFGTLAWRESRRSAVARTQERLSNLARQFADIASLRNRLALARLASVAAEPRLVRALRPPIDADAARVGIQIFGQDTTRNVVTAILDAARQPVAIAGRDAQWLPSSGDTGAVSRLYAAGDSVLAAFSAPVRDGGVIRGYVMQVVHLYSGPFASRVSIDILGPGAKELLTNDDRAVWTDMRTAIPAPQIVPGSDRFTLAGETHLLDEEQVPGSPWRIVVAYPLAATLAPARATLAWLAFAGLLVTTLGAGVAIVVTRRITDPLRRLTVEAEGLARGNAPATRSGVHRLDEIGRLDTAFRAMAADIHAAREDLERQVRERTADLEAAQQTLIHKERMAVLGQLAGSVSHELRNPLGVMSNIAYWLEQTIGEDNPRVGTRLGTLRRQITMCEKIIADILAFTRVREPERTTVVIPELVEEQLGRVRLPAGVRVTCEYGDPVPLALADRVQVGQVVLNLVTNAAQAMDGNGQTLTVRCHAHGARVRIEVEDDGPGVPTELRERIFEPLFTTKPRGIGLGLSVSRTMAAANDGELTVAEANGRGAVFVLELPAAVSAS